MEGLGSSMQNPRSLTKCCYITFLSSRTVSLLSSYTSTSNNIPLSCYLDLLWLTKWGINLKSLHPALATKVFWIIAANRNKLHWQNITPKMTTNSNFTMLRRDPSRKCIPFLSKLQNNILGANVHSKMCYMHLIP